MEKYRIRNANWATYSLCMLFVVQKRYWLFFWRDITPPMEYYDAAKILERIKVDEAQKNA